MILNDDVGTISCTSNGSPKMENHFSLDGPEKVIVQWEERASVNREIFLLY